MLQVLQISSKVFAEPTGVNVVKVAEIRRIPRRLRKLIKLAVVELGHKGIPFFDLLSLLFLLVGEELDLLLEVVLLRDHDVAESLFELYLMIAHNKDQFWSQLAEQH